jgi:hypothetical protein
MPSKKNRGFLKLDWAIFLHETEHKLLNGRNSNGKVSKNFLPLTDEAEFQPLLAKAQHAHWSTRKQAVKDLTGINHPEAIRTLIQLLKDESHHVSWAAMNSLIGMRRAAVRPLFEGLTRDFQSTCFLSAARCILNALYRNEKLTGDEIRVLHSLNNHQKGLIIAQLANEALIAGEVPTESINY